MATPKSYSGLTGWWPPGAAEYGDGDAVGTVVDVSGAAHPLVQANENKKLQFMLNALNGHPAYVFDGDNDEVVSTVNAPALITGASFVMVMLFKVLSLNSGGAGGVNRPGLWCFDMLGTGMMLNGSLSKLRGYVHNTGATTSAEVSIPPIVIGQWHIGTLRHSSGVAYVALDDGDEIQFDAPNYSPNIADNFLVFGRNCRVGNGLRYAHYALGDAFLYNTDRTVGEMQELRQYLRSSYGLDRIASLKTQATRCVSAKLLDNRVSQTALVDFPIPLWAALKHDPMDRVGLSHVDWPSATGAGAGIKPWQRRNMEIQSIEIDPMTLRARATLYDVRRFVRTDWSAWRTGRSGQGTGADGVAELGVGPARAFSRPSAAWVESPAGDGTVVQAEIGEQALDADGFSCFRTRTNHQPRSSFKSGVTGLANLQGPGTRVLNTAVRLFNPEDRDAPKAALEIKADSTIGNDIRQPMPLVTTVFGAAVDICYSLDHKRSSGDEGWFYLQRTSDGWYYSVLLRIWDSVKIWNRFSDLVLIWSANGWERRYFTFQVGASTTTQLTLGVPQIGGIASQRNAWAHLQLETGVYPTRRIVTEDLAVTAAGDVLTLEESSTRILQAPSSFWFRSRLAWGSLDDLAAVSHTVLHHVIDASNYTKAEFVGGALVVKRCVRGRLAQSSVLASKVPWARSGIVFGGARIDSVELESGGDSPLLTAFLGGVPGTPAWMRGELAYPEGLGPGTLYYGVDDAGTAQLDGALSDWIIAPMVLTDIEMARASGPL